MRELVTVAEFVRDILKGLPEFADIKTWRNWIAVLKAIFGLPLDKAELQVFRRLTGRDKPPGGPFQTAWILAGRRSGKSLVAAVILCYLAIFRKWRNARNGVLMCLATDRDQAREVFKYCVAILELEVLKPHVSRVLAETIELKNGLEIAVHTCSYRHIRGRRILAATLDEITFWVREISDPTEIIRALRPALLENEDSIMLAISTVYAKFGVTYDTFIDAYGKEDADRVLFRATTRELNPTFRQEAIDKELAEDPAGASAEYLSEFRSDRETYIPGAVIDAAVIAGRFELEYQAGTDYAGFIDPSGGSRDSMTLAIAHKDQRGIMILDAVREAIPPFDPSRVTEDFSKVLKRYNLSRATGDRYSGEWVRESMRKCGIDYETAELTKSQIYLEFLPLAMSKKVELLDNKRMTRQLRQLERKTGGSKDLVDHPAGGHDDVINAACGALVEVNRRGERRKSRVIVPGPTLPPWPFGREL